MNPLMKQAPLNLANIMNKCDKLLIKYKGCTFGNWPSLIHTFAISTPIPYIVLSSEP